MHVKRLRIILEVGLFLADSASLYVINSYYCRASVFFHTCTSSSLNVPQKCCASVIGVFKCKKLVSGNQNNLDFDIQKTDVIHGFCDRDIVRRRYTDISVSNY